jgi:hypothetical protein
MSTTGDFNFHGSIGDDNRTDGMLDDIFDEFLFSSDNGVSNTANNLKTGNTTSEVTHGDSDDDDFDDNEDYEDEDDLEDKDDSEDEDASAGRGVHSRAQSARAHSGVLMAKVRTLRMVIFQECTFFLRVLQESAHFF